MRPPHRQGCGGLSEQRLGESKGARLSRSSDSPLEVAVGQNYVPIFGAALASGNMDQNLRSNSRWLDFDQYPCVFLEKTPFFGLILKRNQKGTPLVGPLKTNTPSGVKADGIQSNGVSGHSIQR